MGIRPTGGRVADAPNLNRSRSMLATVRPIGFTRAYGENTTSPVSEGRDEGSDDRESRRPR